MTTRNISSAFPYTSQYVEIFGTNIHYIEEGAGDPILFIHDMPVSSYVWRNVIPHLSTLGRCIAPDLVGMGKSGKPNIEYNVTDHITYIEKFIETLNLKRVTLVLHGWGSVIGLHYAMRHEKNCKGLVIYEAFLRPFNEDLSLPFQEQVYSLTQQENIYDLIASGPYYVDKILPQEMLRSLTDVELKHYREPFLKQGSGKVLSQYLKELPKENHTSEANKLIADYAKKLQASKLPKLLLYSVPGFVTTMDTVVWAKANLPNLEMVDVGEELHYAQESNPELMGETVSVWLQGIEQSTT